MDKTTIKNSKIKSKQKEPVQIKPIKERANKLNN